MPPPRDNDKFIAVDDSDSDISADDDAAELSKNAKGKGKAADSRRKRDKGKGKAKDAVLRSSPLLPLYISHAFPPSKHIRGRHLILAHGRQYRRMKQEACKPLWTTGWHEAGDGGLYPVLHSSSSQTGDQGYLHRLPRYGVL